jgi:SAM-dependent methyltransferase
MARDREDFDSIYRCSADYFGTRPERILVEHVDLIDRRRTALDVGAGQGRNALFLAQRGIRVDAIDPSAEAMAALREGAQKRGLPIRAAVGGFEDFTPGDTIDSYGAICLFGLVQLLDWGAIDLLRARVASWSAEGTVLFLTAFTTNDPQFESCRKNWRLVGRNSLADDRGAVRTFLRPGEAPELFRDFEVVDHREEMGPEHRHGDGPTHKHGRVELVLRR